MKGPVLFPGSFDPFTQGHADLVSRALALFPEVVIAIGHNEQKQGWLPAEERMRALQAFYREEPRVRIALYSGLTADFAAACGAACILRGVRSLRDYEYEMNLADVNRSLTGIDTLLLLAQPHLASLSSSTVRELAHYGRDIAPYLPPGLTYNR